MFLKDRSQASGKFINDWIKFLSQFIEVKKKMKNRSGAKNGRKRVI